MCTVRQFVLRAAAVVLPLIAVAAEAQQSFDGTAGNSRMSAAQVQALGSLRNLRSLQTDQNGTPTRIEADLGALRDGAQAFAADSRSLLRTLRGLYRLDGSETLQFTKSNRQGTQRHIRVKQMIDGLEVIGGDAVLHVEEGTDRITAIDSHLLSGSSLPRTERVDANEAYAQAFKTLSPSGNARITAGPRLAFARKPDGKGYLVWDADVDYTDADGERHLDRLLLDTQTGAEVWRIARVHSAMYRSVRYYSNGNVAVDEANPSTTDIHAQTVFNHSGTTYNFYAGYFGRDSWNGAGASMIAYAHGTPIGQNNAMWDGSVTYFGSGNGLNRGPYGMALDVVAHEWTHGVTQTEANLVYDWGEPGGLNEAFSDIMGAAVEAYGQGLSANTWRLGEAVVMPAGTGMAIRYMNDPANDTISRDFYPDLPSSIDPHYSSGVANLAFHLTVQGGTHPRWKTTNYVNPIGMGAAQWIYYLALRDHLLSSSGFSAARNATAHVARQQYGTYSNEHRSVCRAWTAVGVPNDGSQCNLPPPGIYEAAHCFDYNYITWDPAPQASSYEVWLSGSPTNFNHAIRVYAGPNLELELYQSGTAYAKVKACYDDGCGALTSHFARVDYWSNCT